MMRLVLMLLLLLGGSQSVPLGGVFRHVPAYTGVGCTAQPGSGNASCTTGSVLAGQTIVVFFGNNNSSVPVVTDNGTALTALAGSPCNWYAGAIETYAYVETGVSAGTHTISTNVSSGSYVTLMVSVATRGTTDAAACATGNGAAVTGSSITTTSANDLVFFPVELLSGTSSISFSSTPIALSAGQSFNPSITTGYGTVTAASTTYAAATSSVSQFWVAWTIALH